MRGYNGLICLENPGLSDGRTHEVFLKYPERDSVVTDSGVIYAASKEQKCFHIPEGK